MGSSHPIRIPHSISTLLIRCKVDRHMDKLPFVLVNSLGNSWLISQYTFKSVSVESSTVTVVGSPVINGSITSEETFLPQAGPGGVMRQNKLAHSEQWGGGGETEISIHSVTTNCTLSTSQYFWRRPDIPIPYVLVRRPQPRSTITR